MKMFNKINQFIGFHILSFNGWFALFVMCWLYSIYKEEQQAVVTGTTLGFFASIAFYLILGILLLSILIGIIEYTLGYRIKNNFLLNNFVFNFIKFLGILIFLLIIFGLLILFFV